MFVRIRKPVTQQKGTKTIMDRGDGTVSVTYSSDDEDMAQQQFKDQCDVNHIMARYKKQGIGYNQMPNAVGGMSADFTSVTDYQDMLNKVINAQKSFDGLPSDIRERFQNNPSKLLEFIGDENNYDEGVKLGLFNKRPEQQMDTTPEKQNKNQKQNKNKGDVTNQNTDE